MGFNAKRFDSEKFTAGTWVTISVWDQAEEKYQEADFKIARWDNPVFEQAKEDEGLRKAETSQEVHDALMKAMGKGILKDWGEVLDDQGERIPFTPENAAVVLDENPDLKDEVHRESRKLKHYVKSDMEDQAKKPANSSGSKASGAKTDGA